MTMYENSPLGLAIVTEHDSAANDLTELLEFLPKHFLIDIPGQRANEEVLAGTLIGTLESGNLLGALWSSLFLILSLALLGWSWLSLFLVLG